MVGVLMVAQRHLTYPELRLMPDDGKRYEIVDGEVLVRPSPSEKHQRVLRNLSFSMHSHAKTKGLGTLYFAPFDVVFGEKTAFQPDIVFVSAARQGIIGPEYIIGAPDLVVEILSPSGASLDRVTKFEQYARYGVGEYWIVDPGTEMVEIYRLAGQSYEPKGTYSGADSLETPVLPAWRISVRDLFAH